MIRTYRPLPDSPTGYPLDDVWSVIVPVARTNLITNPSFETNTTSWTAIGGSIARVTTQQYHGVYSLAITPTATTTDGARFDTVSLTSGTTYAYSAKLRGVAGLKYKLAIETTGGVELAAVTFVATGRWQWIFGYYTETSSTTRRLTARKTTGNTSTAIFYLDGAQVEAIASGETVSTFIDGAQLGVVPNQNPVAYYWNGTPHASSSTRSGQTRAGGMVIPFKKYGFLLLAVIGLGLAPPQNVATEYARLDGGYDDYTRKPTRQFTLTGRFQGRTYAELRRNRSGLAQLLDRDLIGQDQRLTLLRHVEDGDGRTLTQDVRVSAKYTGGLQGNTDNQHAETVPISFTQYLPVLLADGEDGESLSVQASLASVDYILERSAAGVWSEPGGGTTNNTIVALLYSPAGYLYATGAFTQIGPTAANDIAYWTGSAWAAMSTGLNAQGESMAIEPSGNLIVGGQFLLAGGIANTVKIARWNTTTLAWSALSTGMTGGEVFAVAVAPNGDIYAAGTFTTAGGGAATRVARWDGSAWSALTTGLSGGGLALTVGIDGSIYVGGSFATAGGVTVNNVARWNPVTAAWSALSTGTNGTVETLAAGPNGRLYAAGQFTTAGGVTVTRVASWNGVSWQPMGTGFDATVSQLLVLPDGRVAAVGAFTTAGGLAVPSGYAIWNGSTWAAGDLSTTTVISALALARDGRLAAAPNAAAITVVSPGLTTITNPGTARSYPTMTITGPSSGTARIYSITNPTTNRAIYLNLTISAGEVVTLSFQPDNLSFTSTFQGNIASSILSGSNTADFFLQPGANTIAFLSASSTVTATLSYRPAFLSLDDIP